RGQQRVLRQPPARAAEGERREVPELDPAEGMTHDPIRHRGPASWWRRAAVCATATLVAVAIAVFGFAEDADAHGGVVLTLHGDGHGSVWLTAAWQDGHPVTEPVGMTLMATS